MLGGFTSTTAGLRDASCSSRNLDVSIRNQIIRPIILVGIPNTERRRDLVGPTTVPDEQKAAPHAGGAERFRRFLRDELKPAIAARYRVSSESYIAVDPSGWWNHQAVVRSARALGELPQEEMTCDRLLSTDGMLRPAGW
ncbi:MAG TPA: alpha/beta hydrolase-fold protein [Kofleriaceae bacterium]